MGLLMYGYKEVEEGKKKKDAVKIDPTAVGRSAIRRQPTIRRRDNPMHDRRNAHASPRAVRLSLSNYVVDDRDGEFVIAPRPRPRPTENVTSWDGDSRRTYRAEMEEHSRISTRDPLLTGGANSLQRNHQEPSDYYYSSHMPSIIPPSRESFLRNEIRHDDEIDEIDRAIYERAAAIAHPDEDIAEHNHRYWADTASRNTRRYSPPPQQSGRFAPAFRLGRQSPDFQPTWARNADRRSRSPRRRRPEEASQTSSPVVLSPNFPPLERTTARRSNLGSISLTPRHEVATVDGLGDRRRSPSPADDAWETLITTIAHDERLPSTESSFSSVDAPSSLSTSTTHSQAPTLATSSSLIHDSHRIPYDRDCDESESRSLTPGRLPNNPPVARSVTASVRPDHLQGRVNESIRDEAHDSSSLLYSLLQARRDLDRDFDTYSRMQHILDAYHRRGETVPDEMWQAFGLRNVLAGAAGIGGESGEAL